MKIKVILSTFGPLHLTKSAEFLAAHVNIKVLQGWIPNRFTKFLIRYASIAVKRDLSKSFEKRTPEGFIGKNVSIALPEFFLWFCWRFLPIKKSKIAILAAKLFGFLTKKHIKNADVFHVRSGSGLSGAIEKAKKKGMKVVVDHSIAHPIFMDNQLRSEFEKNNAIFDLGMDAPLWQGVLLDCEKADVLLVNSHFVKDTFVNNGFEESRIKVVYLGVREDFFGLKKSYLPTDKVKLLFTGSFGFRKGAEYLLRALQELDKLNFSYEMTVVGSYNGAKALIEKYRPKHIKFVGHIPQEELKNYLSESDIYLFPSLCEGCASSGMEAMAAGLPVVATLESGFPIIDNVNGIIIPSKSTEAIVNSIIQLAANKNKREELGTYAAKTISENHTWPKYASLVNDIYTVLLKQ
jgi:glycosyltransferase involved in cell wall biosynthesis